jgi:hypothetical protein
MVRGLPQEAWTIAGGDFARPIYWSGAGWSGNARHAVLLVRREDAQRVALNMGLLGPEWDMPDDVRAVPAIKVSAAETVRQLGQWRTASHGQANHAH